MSDHDQAKVSRVELLLPTIVRICVSKTKVKTTLQILSHAQAECHSGVNPPLSSCVEVSVN